MNDIRWVDKVSLDSNGNIRDFNGRKIGGTSTWTTHKSTIDEYLRDALNTPLMTVEEWRARFDPIRQEVTVHCRSEMKHYAHARLGQCPNCGANDWLPSFMLNTDELYELIDYSCAYCGTRSWLKEKR